MRASKRCLKNSSSDDFGGCGNHLRKSAEIMPPEKDDFRTGGVVFVEHPPCGNLPAASRWVVEEKMLSAEIILGVHEADGLSFLRRSS